MERDTDEKLTRARLDDAPTPFASQEALLDAAREMFRARRARREAEKKTDVEQIHSARLEDRRSCRRWHRRVRVTSRATPFSELCRRKRLNRVEREVMMALILERLALIDGGLSDCAELISFLGLSGAESLCALRAVTENGRLHRAGLIDYEDVDEDLRDRKVYPDPAIVESFLDPAGGSAGVWSVVNERALLERMGSLTEALRTLAEAHLGEHRGYGSRRESRRAHRRVELALSGLERTVRAHSDWKLATLFCRGTNFSRSERLILLALIGKEAGHLPVDDSLFLGGGLARASSDRAGNTGRSRRLLLASARLQRESWVQPCSGSRPLLNDSEQTIEEVEFEIASQGLESFGLQRKRGLARSSHFCARVPAVRFDQLVLQDRVSAALRMAMAQARHSRTLFDDWGLASVLPYGTTIGILLSGPPGVGKTACAEAIAHELGRQILVVDYSQVQNCYTGQTEKNIVRIFREASKNQAVLFWDEADAMLYDRGAAHHTWEARDVNVLLQELERFDGVCILATNRKVALDPALSRRISVKIEMARPDRELRRRIWRKLVPRRMPLDPSVDLDRLAESELSGGEIKNVIVNAARLAVDRGKGACVTMADLQSALRQERENRWGRGSGRRLGYGSSRGE